MSDESKYTQYPIKQYEYWTVYLYRSQAYLGRCKIALNREGQLDPFMDTTPEERAELEIIVAALHRALGELYHPDLLNYANFRNTWHRCHWHVIPRYETPRQLGGREFTDHNWGKNYAPYDRTFEISTDLKKKIQADIAAKLS